MTHHKRILSFVFALILTLGALIPVFADEVHATEDKITVMLDPGHAFGDGGGTYAGNQPECYYNMIIALACKEALEAHGGFEVYLSHPDNYTKATLLERGMAADKVNADVIVSIHIDGNTDPNFRGASAMYSVIDKFALPGLAKDLLANVTAKTGLYNRGTYRRKDTGDGTHLYYWDPITQWDVPDDTSVGPLSDYYGIITWGAKFGIPTVILEHGFLTNPDDRAIIENEENLKIMGQADAQTIIEFYTGHTHEWESSRSVDYPTNCVFRGKSSYRCRICKARSDTVLLETPSNDDHYYIITDSRRRTCTVAGYTTYTCRIAANLTDKGYDVGQHTYTVTDYNSGHAYYVTADIPPTHTEDGVHSERCRNCGNVVSTVTPAEGHTWEVISHIPSTCETDGETHEKCTVCGEERHTVLAAPGHDRQVTDRLPPTCTENGYTVHTCSSCRSEITEQHTALGHAMQVKEHVDPTCENDGVHITYCTTCSYEVTDVLAATGHAYAEDEILLAPTFFKHGTQRFVCEHDSAHETTETLFRTAEDWQLALIFGGTPHLFFLLVFLIIFLVRWIKTAIHALIAKAGEAQSVATVGVESEEALFTTEEDGATAAASAIVANANESTDDIVPMEEIDMTDVDGTEIPFEAGPSPLETVNTAEKIDATARSDA